MQIILIGNYPKDNQESMQKFSLMLQSGFRAAGLKCNIWYPIIFFGRITKSTISGFGKWLGYLDKYVIFPIVLILKTLFSNSNTVIYHICDHSNAVYLPYIRGNKKGITCHDVLAIRGALGYSDAHCEATYFGKILQKWILSNLGKAERVAAVSELTFKQLGGLTNIDNKTKWQVIYNSFNAYFCQIDNKIVQERLSHFNLNNKSYILHVGSALPRKNRKLLLQMTAELGNKWDGFICYAGEPIEDELLDLATKLGLKGRIISVVKPDHETLVTLYNGCESFIFPSFSEGFGWPIIEAQSCGVPVIASSVEPMNEISGGAAISISPENPIDFAEAFLRLKDDSFRNQLINKGYENIKRFERSIMTEKYLSLYN
jgi:glycosyltransferase involved in cell wall biosynthesis